MKLIALTKMGALDVLDWRRPHPQNFRTPRDISGEQQVKWWEGLPQRTDMVFWEARTDDWAAWDPEYGAVQAVCGLTHLEWENGRAQISLVCRESGKGIGKTVLALLLDKAFNRMRLHTVYAEVYECNPFLKAWQKMAYNWAATETTIPATKYWEGKHYHSRLFTFYADSYREAMEKRSKA